MLFHLVHLLHFELIVFSPQHLSILDVFEQLFVEYLPILVLLSELLNLIL